MRQIIESLDEPADHLALDEAVLLGADAGELGETIRTWQFDRQVVVLGRSSKVDYEVDRDYCDEKGIAIMRRCSGGASVVGGPGCLMYSVVVSLQINPELRKIDAAHRYVMKRVLTAVQLQVPQACLQGICDLTFDNRKFSGNSLRVSRSHLLYHGTMLFDANLELLARCLCNAPRQPDYRLGRGHSDFVSNVPIDPVVFTTDLVAQFDVAEQPLVELPQSRMRKLRQERYDSVDWHFRH